MIIFCEYHFKLFRENGIPTVFDKDPTTTIKIKKHGKRPTVCHKEHCLDKGEYEIDYC